MTERRIEYQPLDSVKPALRNPKEHHPDLGKSIQRFGFTSPLVVDERTGRLVAGHGRLQALKDARAKELPAPDGVRVSLTDPKGPVWMVPVLRGWSSADDREADAFLLADNKLTEAGGWNEEELSRLLQDVPAPLDGLGFSQKELDQLLKDSSGAGDEEADRPNEVPDEGPRLYVKAGDLWELGGRHRLKVGDSFDEADMRALLGDALSVSLLATDPPYGIYGSSTGIGSDITDDKMVQPFYEKLGALAMKYLPTFGHAYFFCDWRSWSALWVGTRRAGLSAKNLLVWDKGGGGLGSSYAMAYELIGFFAKLPAQKAMQSNVEKGQRQVYRPNLLRHNRPTGQDREHNAAKPVALMQELIRNSSETGDSVLEPFAGSGTTLIAAEREGRTCYAMEMEPRFAQVILERFKRVTGKEVRKL